jgi:hypothetical protein
MGRRNIPLVEGRTMTTRFLAVSNLTWDGRTPSWGRPALEREFSDLEAARAWLKELKTGGSVSDYSRVVETVEAGN